MRKLKLIAAIAFSAAAVAFTSCSTDESYPDTFDQSLIVGKWQNTAKQTEYYRYDANNSGVTWDTADDVTEAEGQAFTWSIDKNNLIHVHVMESGGQAVPKQYTLQVLTQTQLQYIDYTAKKFQFTKVN